MEKDSLIKKEITFAAIVLLIGLVFAPYTNAGINEASFNRSQYTPHDPIYINGNDDFTSENGVTGGSGASSDPYVIEGWEIEASSMDGITIRNVSVFFEIRSCYIHEGGINKDGVVLMNVTNGAIENSLITGNRNGIMFRMQYPGKENSENNKIHNNTITSNSNDGINFEHIGRGYHSDNIISNNNLSNNNRGIYMIMSAENLIFYNNIISNGEGIFLDLCTGGGGYNKIHHNNFINNSEHAYNKGPNKWFKFGRGNYWDDWDGLRFKWARFFPFLLPYKISGSCYYYNKSQFDWFPAYEPYDIEV